MAHKTLINRSKWIVVFMTIVFSLSFAQDFTFSVITSTDNAADGTYELIFGFSPIATDIYDDGMDQYAPPAPPPPSFDAAIGWNSDRYYTQILAGDDNYVEHVYDISLQYPSSNIINVDWDNTGWADLMDSILLQDAFGGVMINVNMLEETTLLVDNPGLSTLKLKVTPKSTAAISGETVPNKYSLLDAYPNPFNPETTIKYSLSQSGETTLVIYDLIGRPVTTLVSEYQPASEYTVVWNGTDKNNQTVSSGVYFYKLTSGHFTSVKKVMLMK